MKSFVQNNLMAGELVMYSSRLHWVRYLQAIPFFLIAILCLVLGLGVLAELSETNRTWVYIAGAIFIGGIVDLVAIHLLVKTSEFAITNKRLIMKYGIISTKTLELLHSKIEAISIAQGICGKIFKYGNFAVIGTGGTVNVFRSIERPFEFRKAAQDEIDKVQKRP